MIPFQKYHIDPTAFLRHDFIVIWGNVSTVAVPLMGTVVYLLYSTETQRIKEMHVIFWMFTIGIIVAAANNQTHNVMWAHTHAGNTKWVI